jgi:recombination protein RecT
MTDTQPDLGQALAATKPGNGVAKLGPKQLLKVELDRYRPAIAKSLPGGYEGGAERFMRSVANAVMTDPTGNLIKCEALSIVGSALHAAQLGLEIGPLNEAYLVPRGGLCTYQTGFRGLIKLAYRGGFDTEAEAVREADEFSYEYGTAGFMRHRPATGQRGKRILWWAMATRLDGGRSKFRVIDEDHIAARRAKGGPVWKQWPEEMEFKTSVRALMKVVPLSAGAEAMVVALNSDGLTRKELDAAPHEYANRSEIDDDYVDGEVIA